MDKFERIINEMAAHTKANPEHGHNCACKDNWLREFRAWRMSLTKEQYKELRYLISSVRDDDI